MKKIKLFYEYLVVSSRLVNQLYKQKKFIQSELEPILNRAKSTNDGSLEQIDFDKIKNYYSLFVVAIVGENYCRLRGLKMTHRERKILSYQGALTGIYDDFFDHPKRKGKMVKEMMDDPFNYQAKDSVERLFVELLQNVHLLLKKKSAFDEIFNSIYNIQCESLQQFKTQLELNELKFISDKKGALSHLFYRITLDHQLHEPEKKCIEKLGALLQHVNDLFDIWKDGQQNISTYASANKDMSKIKAEFELEMQSIYTCLSKLNFERKNIRKFYLQFMILFGMGLVSIDQYIDLQKKNNGVFSANIFDRKALVCDMQKAKNLWRLMKVCLNQNFLIE